jgi:hypothetical protein
VKPPFFFGFIAIGFGTEILKSKLTQKPYGTGVYTRKNRARVEMAFAG